METEIYLYGSLGKSAFSHSDNPYLLKIEAPAGIPELMKQIGIAFSAVQIVMVNHKAVPPGTVINPGDRVAIFSKEYPFFADWKDYRINET